MTVEIVGREKELRSIQAFFKRTNERPAALVVVPRHVVDGVLRQ
jgi:hypothetical protein